MSIRLMDLRAIDLNLLVVLQQLLVQRHVSRAAEQLSMSQPAVSRALQRLRVMFDDPLLVRTVHGFDVSARGIALLPQLNELLKSAEHLISAPVFEPESSTQTLRLYGPDPLVNSYIPPLFERMCSLAPKMKLQVRSDPIEHFELLEKGEVHFVISSLEPRSNTGHLHRLKLAQQQFSIIMSARNPLATETLTMEKYIAARHGFISLTGKGRAFVEQNLIDRGYLQRGEQFHTPLYLSSFTSVGSFCMHSDVLFHLPKQFAEDLARRYDLVVCDPLPGMEPRYDSIYLYWHERYNKDPMCSWVIQQLKEVHGLTPA